MVDSGIARDGGNTPSELGTKLTAMEVLPFKTMLKLEPDAGVMVITFDFSRTICLKSKGISFLLAANKCLGPLRGKARLLNVCDDIIRFFQRLQLVDRLQVPAARKG